MREAAKASIQQGDGTIAIGNGFVSRTLRIDGNTLETALLENRVTGERWPVRSGEFSFGTEDARVRAAEFSIDDVQEEQGELEEGARLTLHLTHRVEKARARVVFELGHEAHYLRKRVAFLSDTLWQGEWLSDVVVEDIRYAQTALEHWGVDEGVSYPLEGSARHANRHLSLPVLGGIFNRH